MMPRVGYCTNVHAGANLSQTRENLQRHSVAVRKKLGISEPLGIGLWLSAQATRELLIGDTLVEFREWLRREQLLPFTFNGFPYGDFHQREVKYRVYEPNWTNQNRQRYTLDLIRIQDALLPAGHEGSISTLPIAWGSPPPSDAELATAGQALIEVVAQLAQLESGSGRLIFVCLEPEPGCVLQRSRDVVNFFQRFLLPLASEQTILRHLRVCHDICHAAVMFEEQSTALATYREAGILLGKVQVSSAIQVNFDEHPAAVRSTVARHLTEFAEDRYLHQTMVRAADGSETFFDDLPEALAVQGTGEASGRWRVHFHVPVDLPGWGQIDTTQDDIFACLGNLAIGPEPTHFEVETYAWSVLPPALRVSKLADGIAREMQWLQSAVRQCQGP